MYFLFLYYLLQIVSSFDSMASLFLFFLMFLLLIRLRLVYVRHLWAIFIISAEKYYMQTVAN